MGTRTSTRWILVGIALIASSRIAGSSGANGDGYLPRVGPTPLRYYIVRASEPLALPPMASEDGVPGDVPAPLSTGGDFTPFRRSAFVGSPNDSSWPSPLWLSRFAGWNGLDSPPPFGAAVVTNATFVPFPASDLLAMTPDMLADYFKPVQFPTNTANVMILVPVGFTPATPAASGSTATYKSP